MSTSLLSFCRRRSPRSPSRLVTELTRRCAFVFFIAPVALLGCSGSTSVPGASQANPLDTEETALFNEFVMMRQTAGLPPVVQCKTLNVEASAHSDDMRDKDYLSDTGQDGSTPRVRACGVGYQAACATSTSMAELVASGDASGVGVFNQWSMDATTEGILSEPALVVVGVGRAIGGRVPMWTLDLANVDEASCH